jgi:hypothetical protein
VADLRAPRSGYAGLQISAILLFLDEFDGGSPSRGADAVQGHAITKRDAHFLRFRCPCDGEFGRIGQRIDDLNIMKSGPTG